MMGVGYVLFAMLSKECNSQSISYKKKAINKTYKRKPHDYRLCKRIPYEIIRM
jgi:hypothetical protein